MTLRHLTQAFARVIHRYGEHKCSTLAGALAFNGLLSALPLALLVVAMFGAILGSPQRAISLAHEFAASFLPDRNDLVANTFETVAETYHVAGAVGVVGLLLSGSAFFGQLELSMNVVFESIQPRSWLRSRLIAVVCTLATILLVGVSLLTSFVQTLGGVALARVGDWTGIAINGGGLARAISTLASIAVSVIVVSAVYTRFPNARVRSRSALVVAVWVSIGWEIAKVLFGLYLARYAAYHVLYGPIAGVAIAAVWLYYSMCLMLFGAEWVAQSSEAEEQKAPRRSSTGP